MKNLPHEKIAISLSEASSGFSGQDRKIIDAEKKYYEVVVSLKKKRESLGLTQSQLADLSDLPRTTITKVESGSRNATLQTLMAIAQAMGKNVELRLT